MKQCPECDRQCGPRVRLCPCGHDFKPDSAACKRDPIAPRDPSLCVHCQRAAEVFSKTGPRWCLAHCPAEALPENLRMLLNASHGAEHVRAWLDAIRGAA